MEKTKITIDERRLLVNQDYVYYLPEDLADFTGLRTLRSGLFLGIIKKNRFEPSHSLALSLNKDDAKRYYNYSSDSIEVNKYLHGETLEGSNQKGYGLILVDGYPLSFYKESNNQIKNLYPKGLRR